MFESLSPDMIFQKITNWFLQYIWSEDTLIQAIFIVIAFLLSNLLYRYTHERLTETVDSLSPSTKVKQAYENLKRLLIPLGMLVFMFFASMILASDYILMDISFTRGIMKVMLAWIAIRAAVEFIENNLIRNFLAIGIWVVAALSILGILEQTMTALDAMGFNIGSFRLSALVIIKSAFSIFALLYIAIFASSFFERHVFKTKSLTRSSQVLISKIIRIVLITIAILIGITSAGIDLSVLTVFSGALGLGIGFGLQKVASNLFSGFILLLDRSIEPGDVIELEKSGTFGWVHHMGARYTEITTRDNKSYLIPNEEFIVQNVVNWSHGSKLIRLEIKFGVHYDCDPHQVTEIAKKAALVPSRVVETPSPKCWIYEFGDSSINYSLRFWIKDAEAGVTNIRGQVFLAVWDAFKENGIKIPYPHREVFIHNVNSGSTEPK